MNYHTEKAKAYRSERKARGECIICGHNNPDTKYDTCPECREYMRKKGQERREERRAKGLCIYCGKKPALTGKDECGCRTAYVRRKYEQNAKNGVCVICGKRPVDGVRSKKMCSVCLDAHLIYSKRYIAKRAYESVEGKK